MRKHAARSRSYARRDRSYARRDPFASKFSLYGCVGSVLSLAILAAMCQISHHDGFDAVQTSYPIESNAQQRSRRAQEVGGTSEIEDVTCGNIFLHVKKQPSSESISLQQSTAKDELNDGDYGQRLCQYARNCEGDYPSRTFLPLILCHGVDTTNRQHYFLESVFIYALLPPILLFYLLLLFRLLATTADSYFSPALESFSFELGLPPRFAGATLLALGNGSPDLGSTVNAILLWNEASATQEAVKGGKRVHQGWRMAFGSLTGGGMFVGTIVCGLLIQSCSGIPCRWAFLRDVSMYAFSVCFVWYTLEAGRIMARDAQLFLGIYLAYVTLVFCADMYHRKVTLPRLHLEGKKRRESLRVSLRQQLGDGVALNEITPLLGDGMEQYGQVTNDALDRDDNDVRDAENAADQITTLSGDHIPRHPRLSATDRLAMMMSNYDPKSVKYLSSRSCSGDSGDSSDEWEAITTVIHDVHPGIPHASSDEVSGDGVVQPTTRLALASVPEEPEELSVAAEERTWSLGLFRDAYEELAFRFHNFLTNCFQDDETSLLEKVALFFELPFVAMRTVTVPVPVEEHYCRQILALSMALSPYWLMWYISSVALPAAAYCFLSLVAALLILRYADDETLPQIVSVPISLYGFFIAATWIDTIADLLVSLLQFLGTISRIPASILGITVLAWGNSMGDLSANLAMARKGMPDMATTGCFAGPAFNLLIGSGIGFLYLQYELQRNVVSPLSLTPAIRIGFACIILNCLLIVICGILFKGTLPYRYSFALFTLYALFIALSLKTVFDRTE